MKKTLKILNYVDWALGVGTLVAGLLWSNWLVVAAGVLGLVFAWYKPAERIKARLEKRLLRKKAAQDHTDLALAEDAFYEQVLGKPEEADTRDADERPDFSRTFTSYAGVYLRRSRHNRLTREGLNLA